ncbi:MAG TPA: hypothetical protein VNA25_00965 [Phycisphaerae bacterium]|nr:hypothetical protein [Phycisphaerae bacterium]
MTGAQAMQGMGMASVGMQVMNTLIGGNAKLDAAKHVAAQERQKAGQTRASAQRDANEKRRQGRLLSSKAQTRAAASGGDAGSPDISVIMGDIGAEAEYRALTEMFIGEEKALGLEDSAALRIWQGKQEKAGSRATAFSQAVSGLAKYGGDWFDKKKAPAGGGRMSSPPRTKKGP